MSAISLTGLNTGERPQIETTWTCSNWDYVNATFPNTTTRNVYNPAPVAAGSFDVQTVGTTTRNKRTMRNFSVTINPNVVPSMGPGGAHPDQVVIGAKELGWDVDVSWTEDADAATTTPVLPGYGTSTDSKRILYTLSCADGSAVCLFFPKVCITNIATQTNDGGVNRLTVTGKAYSGDTLTSDLTRAPIVLGYA